jgi:hypothetical protein
LRQWSTFVTNRWHWPLLLALLAPALALAIDNEFVRVSRDEAPCSAGRAAGCGDRVLVALGDVELESGQARRRMVRGDVAVFNPDEAYARPRGSYLEVAIKPGHPASQSPGESIPPEKNAMLHEAEDFFVFEEKLQPGDTRARHTHSQRVVIQLNRAKLRQWPDDRPELELETVPDTAGFSPPVIHAVRNIGEVPLRGIIVEFRPGKAGPAAR